MEEQFAFIKQLKQWIGPVGVTIDIYQVKGIYYLELDGTTVYSKVSDWNDNWGVDFAGWTWWYVGKFCKRKPKSLTETKVKYKIGTIMDILKDVE